MSSKVRPKLARRVRVVHDRTTGRTTLLYPERGLVLEGSAVDVVSLCDGTRTVVEMVDALATVHRDAPRAAILEGTLRFLTMLAGRGVLEGSGAVLAELGTPVTAPAFDDEPGLRPYTLVAELTHRCPLRCPYCSNPLDLVRRSQELGTEAWSSLLQEAASLGVLQVHFTGGEPLLRQDLEVLVASARAAGLYTNLVTSGVPLVRSRLEALAHAGLEHVQVSVQAADAALADGIAGCAAAAHKADVLRWVKDAGLPLTINVVLHAANIGEVDDLVALAEAAGAERLELANVQLLAWALENERALLPSRSQVDDAARRARAHAERLRGVLDVAFVKPDYFRETPKACMDGWARRFLHVTPDGMILPCQGARSLPGLAFERAGERPLSAIWTDNPGLTAFRGDAWMREPCRSCDERAVDFGGCRCQAFALTGDAREADPACAKSPFHAEVSRAAAGDDARARRYLHRGSSVTPDAASGGRSLASGWPAPSTPS